MARAHVCVYCHDLDRSHAINKNALSTRLRSVLWQSMCHVRNSNIYQLKSGHALMGVYLKSTDNMPYDHCWWCDLENNSGTHQTRDHLFKHCYKWKDQQAAIWARVKEATKGK